MKEKPDIRIIDIAEMAGVSIGTVDRVIHNRGNVSEEKLQKIKAVLKSVNYTPNIFARSLVSKKRHKIVALIPAYYPDDYWMYVANGFNKAAAEIKTSGISFETLFFDQYDEETFANSIKELLALEFDGVVMANFFRDHVIHLSKILDAKNIPYTYIDAHIEDQNPLAYFGMNSYDSGAVAAKIMTGRIDNTADILISHMSNQKGERSNQVINREKGFLDYIGKSDFSGNIIYVDLNINSAVDNMAALDTVFEKDVALAIQGAITFNSTCHVLGNYLKSRNKGIAFLMGYDLIEKNRNLLKEGVISLLIGQRPEEQGYKAVRVLTDKLLLNINTDKINYMPIDILIKENIDYYK
mgnify:CR=1 FL=1